MAEQPKYNLVVFSFRIKEYLCRMVGSTLVQKLRSKLPKVFLQTVILYSYYHLLTEYFFDVATCHGFSMEPTLYTNDIVLIQKRDRYSVKKGDIVVVRDPANPKKFLCKRVIYTAGDIIHTPIFSGKIPKGSIWLQGDNVFRSSDSRSFGPVPKGLILGKAMYVIWPVMKDLRAF